VTLVSVVSASGEVERIPWGRRGAAQLGMVTFSIGVLTQQWHIAVMGIVYSYLTAAAIWQNFRARLPYLYDPWSERMPPPPTLMHAMIAISILVEGVAVVSGILAAIFGRNNIAVAQSASYAVCSVLVAAFTARFLRKRGVRAQDVWCWRDAPISAAAHEPWWRAYGWDGVKTLQALLAGVIGGAALGLFAHGYLAAVEHIPVAAEILRRSQEQMTKIANLRVSYAVMAVLFAPLAEEYLFRGLLFRALDREWGGWRALVGSAAFFAIYHPPLAWPPVFLLGVTNAVLFKKTRQLAPAVLLHMAYNAVVSL
jgi:membrane protease YdiL (CAAX protease family)